MLAFRILYFVFRSSAMNVKMYGMVQAEEDFRKANPFVKEDAMEEPLNASVFSGVSDKSILLR
jgi:hypothetical protein